MDTTYRLITLGERGMYTYGDTAATPELARIAVGNLIRRPRASAVSSEAYTRRLGIERTEWTIDEHTGKPRAERSVLIEAESQPGEWTIG